MTRSNETLEDFFAAAKAMQTLPEAGLMDRILRDAATVQIEMIAAPTAPKVGFWVGFADTLGGWRGMSSLTACACAGLWFGFATPQTVSDFSAGLISVGETAQLDYDDPYGLQELLTEI